MPPRLLLLNGPPGVGKSTLARRLVDSRPLSLCLEVDLVRAMLGGWQDSLQDSGLLARDLAVDMARRHLVAGHDVLVPQTVGRLPFVDRLEALAQDTGANFRHVLLTEDRDRAVARFEARLTAADRTEQHVAAAETSGGRSGLLDLYDAVQAVAAARRGVLVVRSVEGDVDGTLRRLRQVLEEP